MSMEPVALVDSAEPFIAIKIVLYAKIFAAEVEKPAARMAHNASANVVCAAIDASVRVRLRGP